MTTACYVCGSQRTVHKLREGPIERRFGKPVLPSEDYSQRECQECGLLFVDCEVSEQYLDDLYSSESVEWQKEFTGAEESVGTARLTEFQELSRIMLHEKPWSSKTSARVLDFGCQTGEFNDELGKLLALEPFGVEMSSDYAEHALALWKRGRVHVGGLAEAPFAPASFDYISAQEVLEHLVDPRKVVQQLRRLITDDGMLLISVPASDYFILKKRLFSAAGIKRNALVHTHIYNFTPRSMRLMLEDAGFKTVQTFGIGWHGRARLAGNALSGAIRAVTGGNRIFSPSLVALARPA